MKTTFTLCFSLCAGLFFVSCKTSSPTAAANNYGTPTPVGTPIGSPSTATIDASGGSLMSPDGRLEVIIPAGALSSATPISIQPVTNECSVGAGVGFSLSPNGQKFSQPVTLRFHYAQDDLIGSAAKALAVATQKDDRIWYAFNDPILDTTARTLSISSSHFSMYALCHDFWITPASATIKINESQKLEVKQWKVTNLGTTNNPIIVIDGDMTYPQGDQVSWIINGKILGSQADGVVSPNISSSTTTYYAPASTKGMTSNPAQVSAEVNLTDGSQTIVFSNVKVGGDSVTSYHVVIKLTGDSVPAGSATFTYLDSASFDITGNPAWGDSVQVSSLVNVAGYVTGWTNNPSSGCTTTKNGEGDLLKVISVSGSMAQITGQSTQIALAIYGLTSTIPYTMVCNNGTTTLPSYTGPRDYQTTMTIDSTAQTVNLDGDTGMTVLLTITRN